MRALCLLLVLGGCGALVHRPDGSRRLTADEAELLERVDAEWRATELDDRGRCGAVYVLEVPLDEAMRRCLQRNRVGASCYLAPHRQRPYVVLSHGHPKPRHALVHEFVHYREDCWLGRSDWTHSRAVLWGAGGVNLRAQEGL